MGHECVVPVTFLVLELRTAFILGMQYFGILYKRLSYTRVVWSLLKRMWNIKTDLPVSTVLKCEHKEHKKADENMQLQKQTWLVRSGVDSFSFLQRVCSLLGAIEETAKWRNNGSVEDVDTFEARDVDKDAEIPLTCGCAAKVETWQPNQPFTTWHLLARQDFRCGLTTHKPCSVYEVIP